ncbi:MAG: hypothetical protein DWQ31_09250 [Planctomycetota bacterium]|nr:MAG: hypothetical protein DWQ31_09250 [Planctomycetota bacterium]REJ91364.1 MAG: hypothetical protein DWQ35_14515 [Planctomycetota bacterium]REK18516.1 MAG: hypothetical protein DWQ42_20170 [Planctomycetota bacterium]REK39424.1 MAG: hypothetical protein DWQ46_19335 [Planctomycetota bacterium]
MWLAIFATLYGLGMWLLLPRRIAAGRAAGAVLMTAAVAILGTRLVPPGALTTNILFYALAAVTVVSAVCAMTFRSPVYSAIFFAVSVLATAGLFLVNGAQFLGVAMVVVYAGAIVVMFLFVLMLAQPEGLAFYDRLAFEPLLCSVSSGVLVFLLTITLLTPGTLPSVAPLAEAGADGRAADGLPGVEAEAHVAAIGARLFSEHLISVQVVGVLLFVALVAAAAIASQSRRSPPPRTAEGGTA